VGALMLLEQINSGAATNGGTCEERMGGKTECQWLESMQMRFFEYNICYLRIVYNK